MSINNIPSILFIDPDESFMTVMSYNLERCGYIVNTVKDSNLALHSSERVTPSLVIISDDVSGSLSAAEFCSVLASKSNTKNVPIILLSKTADAELKLKNSHENIVEYLVKPFATSELISKVRALLSGANDDLPTNTQMLEYKNLRMNVGSYRVTRGGQTIHLGPTEFKILQCFMQLPSKVLSREEIIVHVWGYKSQIDPRTIDVHINRLRSALNNDNEKVLPTVGVKKEGTPSIRTIRSMGYCLS